MILLFDFGNVLGNVLFFILLSHTSTGIIRLEAEHNQYLLEYQLSVEDTTTTNHSKNFVDKNQSAFVKIRLVFTK